MKYFIHPTSILDKNIKIGSNTKIWHWCHLSKDVVIGKNCTFGQNIFIGEGVREAFVQQSMRISAMRSQDMDEV